MQRVLQRHSTESAQGKRSHTGASPVLFCGTGGVEVACAQRLPAGSSRLAALVAFPPRTLASAAGQGLRRLLRPAAAEHLTPVSPAMWRGRWPQGGPWRSTVWAAGDLPGAQCSTHGVGGGGSWVVSEERDHAAQTGSAGSAGEDGGPGDRPPLRWSSVGYLERVLVCNGFTAASGKEQGVCPRGCRRESRGTKGTRGKKIEK